MKKGFTLIELIIVIAILGILSAVAFVLINPAERQASARDTNRITTVMGLGKALQIYYTEQAGYPGDNWAQDLITHGDLTNFPDGTPYTVGEESNCSNLVQPFSNPTYCYNHDFDNGSIVYARAESRSHTQKCTTGDTYFVYSTSDGRGGTICSLAEPTPWVTGSVSYVD